MNIHSKITFYEMKKLYSTRYLALQFYIDTTHVQNVFVIFQPIWSILIAISF